MAQKKIDGAPRPLIPYEHPDAQMYLRLLRERLIRLRWRKRAYTRNDAALRACFADDSRPLEQQCDMLVRYVAEAFVHYAVWDYSHAYYPGRPSQQNARTDAMEGCSRVLPTLAAWLHGALSQAKGSVLSGLNGQRWDIADLLSRAFLAGTDPAHPGYWGTLHDYDQRICESADLALALWLSKRWVWAHYDARQREQILAWFAQVPARQTVDNNWHLFGLTVEMVLRDLRGEGEVDQQKYQRIKEFHVGEGWFRDGARGNYDYYNAWGFHYSLYWLNQIDPQFDRAFIQQALQQFNAGYRHLLTPQGIAFFGRSACYRLAAAAPLLAEASQTPTPATLGVAKRALASTLRYFIANGAMRAGAPTQGLFADDARLVDNYSGPASSFWSLRALNIALYSAPQNGLWQVPEQPLPIEQADFSLCIEATGMQVFGCRETGESVVVFRHDYTQEQTPLSRRLSRQRPWPWLLERLTGRAERPKNNLLRKGVTCYSSKMDLYF
ncbi:hypothetical protein A9798_04710 [Edwardsiella hoshinae]|uniref:Uncharacterized protein conserved in bacteria n=1 Tax=Edwardsiella hoshinae TaxID=93378 RepID=A0A376DA72_9GAMM|nr:DUF2264 domain-containing protein [Edwardsiella hoshinae]AOV96313.1 hypothetical protein A9798_04710 [Edwardsiella hoshinae]QPR27806.1 DUF2264 domain-containing protein [Edwardsiella hoshinae]STC85941.1 Uncharacterized protein conserved in bacteria [Edwardsiella hoshinae]